MLPLVTSIYTALAALLVIALAVMVVNQRRRSSIGLGDGGDRALQQCIRVHANALENLPIALLLLLLLELTGTPTPWLHGFGCAVLASRLLHAWGFSRHPGTSFGRLAGTALGWLAQIAMALLLLWRALG